MRRRLLIGLLLLASASSSGCYYSHLVRGQLEILWARQPIEEALSDPELPERTRDLLGLVEPVRAYAEKLGLRVGDQYTSYVDWPSDRIVTTLVRTRFGSLESVPYWFPIVGRLPYKGYFDRERAETEAERLREESYDVCVTGVAAYSTLGWLDDPVTAPMLRRGPATLVETILHELVHATAFVQEETAFNESVAQFIGQEAAIRFFGQLDSVPPTAHPDGWPDAQKVRDFVEDRRAIARVTVDFREQLIPLDGLPDRSEQRALGERETRDELASLPLRVLEPQRIAKTARLSDACLALRGTYAVDLPRHARVLEALGGDLEAMIARLARWAEDDLPIEHFFDVERV